MGGGQSKMQVQQIRKSSISKSPKIKNSKEQKSPIKSVSPDQRKKVSQSTPSLPFGNKVSSSTSNDNSKSSQQVVEGLSKKKIKSVKKIPQSLQRHKQVNVAIEETEQLNVSGRYDRKAKNQKHQMHKLLKIYDLG